MLQGFLIVERRKLPCVFFFVTYMLLTHYLLFLFYWRRLAITPDAFAIGTP